MAVEHLVALGHARIAHYWYGKEKVVSGRLRRDGFLGAVEQAGLLPAHYPIYTDQQTNELARDLQTPDGPKAVFCYNDALAVELLDVCLSLGLSVPGDVSLVGFDDNILATTARPRLTTVQSPLVGMAQAALDLLEKQQAGEDAPAPVWVAPSLVVRESTAPP